MVDSVRMLNLDDNRWNSLAGGYRMKCDPRPLLAELESEREQRDEAWRELWEELHHQGDVGEASYASVPHLVRIHRKSGVVDWNTYAIVADHRTGPWDGQQSRSTKVAGSRITFGRFGNWRKSVPPRFGAPRNRKRSEPYSASLLIARGLRTHGRFLVEYSEDELLDIECSCMKGLSFSRQRAFAEGFRY